MVAGDGPCEPLDIMQRLHEQAVQDVGIDELELEHEVHEAADKVVSH